MDKKKVQSYYNIATGVTISLLTAMILAAWGWVVKMQATINKADLALREVERSNKEIENTTSILHRRITESQNTINDLRELTARIDERSENSEDDINALTRFIQAALLK